MKICLLVIGKTDAAWLQEALGEYERRVQRYVPYERLVIPDVKRARGLSEALQREREGELITGRLEGTDTVVLLDERGVEYSSREFSGFLARKMQEGVKRLVFVIGGPYGFSERVYERAGARVSLSRMTFSHQMARVIFAEQLYRAMTIWKGEPYHHE
jgi:23S rRNA (pseudouridine1915-N3)-methyltransferase